MVALQITMVVTGIGLALIYERRKNLVSDIAGHAAFNLVAVVAIAAGAGYIHIPGTVLVRRRQALAGSRSGGSLSPCRRSQPTRGSRI